MMNKSVERVTRIAAVAAGFIASPGQVALGESAKQRAGHPTIAQMAAEVDKLPTSAGETGNTAYYTRVLSKHELASVTLTGTQTVRGKPDPKHIDSLSIDIYSDHNTGHYIVPRVSVSFLKQANSTWNTYSTTKEPGANASNTSIHLEEIGESYTRQYTQSVTNEGISSPQDLIIDNDPAAATRFLRSVEFGAQSLLQAIKAGKPVNIGQM